MCFCHSSCAFKFCRCFFTAHIPPFSPAVVAWFIRASTFLFSRLLHLSKRLIDTRLRIYTPYKHVLCNSSPNWRDGPSCSTALSLLWRSIELYLGMRKPNWLSSSNQSGLMTQIRIHPRATQQSRVKCRCHGTVPAVPTQEAIPEEGGSYKKIRKIPPFKFWH